MIWPRTLTVVDSSEIIGSLQCCIRAENPPRARQNIAVIGGRAPDSAGVRRGGGTMKTSTTRSREGGHTDFFLRPRGEGANRAAAIYRGPSFRTRPAMSACFRFPGSRNLSLLAPRRSQVRRTRVAEAPSKSRPGDPAALTHRVGAGGSAILFAFTRSSVCFCISTVSDAFNPRAQGAPPLRRSFFPGWRDRARNFLPMLNGWCIP